MGRNMLYTILIKRREDKYMEHIINLTAYLPQQEAAASKRPASRQALKLLADFLDAAVSAVIGLGILTFFVVLLVT